MASLSQFGLFALLLYIVSPPMCDGAQVFPNTTTSLDTLLNIPARLVALEQTMSLLVGERQEDRSSSKSNLVLREDIVADVNQGRFAIAEEKMLELHDPAVVADLVREMSANSDHDFVALVNLTKSLNNTSLQAQVLKNMYYAANESDNISIANLITLAKCLSEEGKGYQYDRVIGINSFKKLLHQIAGRTITTLADVMKWQLDYRTNSEVRALAAGIAEWRDVSKKVMTGLVSAVFGAVDNHKILEAVSNHTDPWQALVGVDALIDRLNETDLLKGTIGLDIVFSLNEILTRQNLDPMVQANALQVKKKLPQCIRNFTSLTGFCIWSKYWNSILLPSSYNPDPRVKVVIRPRKNSDTKSVWRHYKHHDKLVLQNVYHESTLQASNVTFRDAHNAFTTDGLVLDDESAWLLEPAGDYCYLKSYWNHEYLFGSIVEFKGDNLALTKKLNSLGSPPSGNTRFTWQFVDC